MNIWCVGRNYADHIRELGNETPSEPLIFLKAGSTLTKGPDIQLPAWAEDVHHELELALQFDEPFNLTQMALALDLTERAAQTRLKAKGQPWTLAKSFRGACPMSEKVPARDLADLRLRLLVNGEIRQDSVTALMIYPPEVLKKYILDRYPVEPGDWLLTGTPAGVGPLHPGDRLEAFLEKGAEVVLKTDWRVL